jgi:hypothetical protein
MTCGPRTPPRRSCAVFFHQGAPALGEGALRTERGLGGLRAAAAAHLPAAGLLQVATALDMLAAAEARLGPLRRQLRETARRLTGARVLAERLSGVGPIAALARTCWLGGAGRFSSSAKAVRFTGLDVTVWSSDRKGPPGRLSRQGPPVLRWAVDEAGQTHGRAAAPDHGYYAQVKDRKNGKRAALAGGPARSSGRPATSWPSSATTPSPAPDTPDVSWRPRRGHAGPGQERLQPHSPDGGTTAASSCKPPVSRCRQEPGGRPKKTERPHPAGGDTAG